MNNSTTLKSILVIAANPKGTQNLRLQEEEREIRERLRLAGYGKVPINSTGATRARDIQQAMLDFRPQIVHFSGHGSGQDGLVFENMIGQEKLVSSEALANLFKLFASQVECVVLNACYSQVQAEAIAKHINYVIGMSQEIGDRAAIEFSVGFYMALGAGEAIEFAYELGCNAIQLEGVPEHLTPVLYRKQENTITCPACLQENYPTVLSCLTCGYLFNSSYPNYISYHLPTNTILKQGQYKIDKPIGEGGFGITYKGCDVINDRYVAIKERWPERAIRQGKEVIWSAFFSDGDKRQQIEAFTKEASYLMRFSHPNIVKIYDSFEENQTAYIVMELIEGRTLREILESKGIIQESDIRKYMMQIAKALKLMHLENILHRDIKPDSIFIDRHDNAILIDFGNARESFVDGTQRHTAILTADYAPLEQFSAKGRRTLSSDIYSLCASMYHLLTGNLPIGALERFISESDTLIPPRQLAPFNISPEMDKIILKGMGIRPKERFQTVDDLIAALLEIEI